MKEKLVAKTDEHIRRLLEKQELTNEEYAILKERLREIRFAEEEAERRMEWDSKIKDLTAMLITPPAGGGLRV